LEFSELDALEYNMDFLRRDLAVLKVSDILVVKSSTVEGDEEKKKAETAVPGSPAYRLVQ
jgi:leucyl-tRNA synthetase